MTKRYFYTDPLAAAWMAKHFGMRLCAVHTDEQMEAYDIPAANREFDWFESCVVDGWERDVEMVSDAVKYIEAASDKIYIHPDSVPLLIPQAGDRVTAEQGVVGGVGYKYDGSPLVIFWAGSDKSQPLRGDERVIQRNGMPFMWPESEEA